MSKESSIPPRYLSYLPYVIIIALVFGYYRYEWKTFPGFITSIDRGAQFLQDFTNYYYPMSRQIIGDPLPIPGYFYPSFFALVLYPLGLLPLPAAQVIWGIFQVICFFALLYLPLRHWIKIKSFTTAFYLLLFVTSYPLLNNYKWGQVSVSITLGILVVFLLLKKNRPILAGILLAFITAIKLYPLVFVVLFLMKRNMRALAAFAISLLIFYFIFPASMLGFSNWIEFEKIALSEITSAGWVMRDVNSQYAAHVGLRWFEVIFHRAGGDFIRGIFTIAGYALALACIVKAWTLQSKGEVETRAASIAAIFLCLPFLLSTSWPHYFAYLPFCQSILLVNAIGDTRSSSLAKKTSTALLVISMLLSSVIVFNLFPDWGRYNSYGMLFLSNLILIPVLFQIKILDSPKTPA